MASSRSPAFSPAGRGIARATLHSRPAMQRGCPISRVLCEKACPQRSRRVLNFPSPRRTPGSERTHGWRHPEAPRFHQRGEGSRAGDATFSPDSHSPPPLHPVHSLFYAGPTRGSVSQRSHAAPDRQISALVHASRNLHSARVRGDCCPGPCLLHPQNPSVPRFHIAGTHATRNRCIRLLQPRLLSRRDHISMGKSATGDEHFLLRWCRSSRHRFAPKRSRHATLRLTIHPRPSANLHRLNYWVGKARSESAIGKGTTSVVPPAPTIIVGFSR
jgi:hypothetical protein